MDLLLQSAGYRNLRSSWGYDEIETRDGIGFIGWGFEAYNPTIDLKKVAIKIGRLGCH